MTTTFTPALTDIVMVDGAFVAEFTETSVATRFAYNVRSASLYNGLPAIVTHVMYFTASDGSVSVAAQKTYSHRDAWFV